MQPRTREERSCFKHKENLERERLRNRTGDYFRYEDIPDPLAHEKACPGYIPEKERLQCGQEFLTERFLEERDDWRDKRNAVTEKRRGEQLKREEDRWVAIEHKELAEEDRQKRYMADPLIGKKNVSGVPYNIVNLAYDDNYEGRKLRHDDDMVKYRGEVRKANLAYKGHLGFNPIVGEQSYPILAPTKPDPFTEEQPVGYEAKFSQLG